MYLDLSKILSFNALLNFIIASRGIGKSYGTTKFVIKKFLEKQEEFVYIRRYKSELQKSIPKFFDAMIKNEEFKDVLFGHKGSQLLINEKVAGYGVTLSTAQQLKSTNFSNVKTIIFDEFIIEKGQGHYLKDEVNIFLGLIETIARLRNVRVLLLGNSADLINPYFLYFDMRLPYNNDIITFKNGLIALQYATSSEYINVKKQSRFGQLVKDTSFEEYAIENKFVYENNDFIEKKDKDSRFSFAFIYKDYTFGVWINWNNGKMYISNDYDSNGLMFATTTNDHKPNTMLLSVAKKYYSWNTFINNYKLGNVYFESLKIKTMCHEVMKMLVRF